MVQKRKKTGKLVVTGRVLAALGRLLQKLQASVPLAYVVWPLSVCAFSLSPLLQKLPPNL